MDSTRRNLLVGGGVFAASALAFGPLRALFAGRSAASPPATPRGALVADANGVLDLPAGFSYEIVERFGDLMSDDYRVPGLPDGMACFPGESPDELVLLRNHEVDRRALFGVARQLPPEAYDAAAFGGVTRLVVDARTGKRRSSNLVLAGTLRNCAGGPSPWGWLSCEETTVANHGYVFACDPRAKKVAAARKIPGYGRFNHEAVAVDPTTNVAYLTEDQNDGCLYRFLPSEKNRPWDGELQALAVVGKPGLDTATKLGLGEIVEVEWVSIPDPDPTSDSVRHQARERGAASVRRGEGIAIFAGAQNPCESLIFTATTGGPRQGGQIFKLTPGRGARDRLELIAQADETNELDMPDNLTVAPWGDVYLCEDGGGGNYLRVLKLEGGKPKIYDLARNARSLGELAGVCFSPDGSLLFVNLQIDGLTVAIRGPFQKLGTAT